MKKAINKIISRVVQIIQIACEECCLEYQIAYSAISGCMNIQITCPVTTKRGGMAQIQIETNVRDKGWNKKIEIWTTENGMKKLRNCTTRNLIDSLTETKNAL